MMDMRGLIWAFAKKPENMQTSNNKVYQIMFSERRFEQMGNLYVLTKPSHQLKTKREWYSLIINKFIDSHPLGFKIRHMSFPFPTDLLTEMNKAIDNQRKQSNIGSKCPLIQESISIKIEQSLAKDFKQPNEAWTMPNPGLNDVQTIVSTWVSEDIFKLINHCVANEVKSGKVKSKKEWVFKAVVDFLKQSPAGFKRRGTHCLVNQAKFEHFLTIQRNLNGRGSAKQIIDEAFQAEIIKNYALLYQFGLQ